MGGVIQGSASAANRQNIPKDRNSQMITDIMIGVLCLALGMALGRLMETTDDPRRQARRIGHLEGELAIIHSELRRAKGSAKLKQLKMKRLHHQLREHQKKVEEAAEESNEVVEELLRDFFMVLLPTWRHMWEQANDTALHLYVTPNGWLLYHGDDHERGMVGGVAIFVDGNMIRITTLFTREGASKINAETDHASGLSECVQTLNLLFSTHRLQVQDISTEETSEVVAAT